MLRRHRAIHTSLPLAVLVAALARHLPLRLAFVPLRLVTFDLDDTLWPQDAVVARANAAMTSGLQKASRDIGGADVVAGEMRIIRQERSELAKKRGEPPYKISYSDLRKEGIQTVLQRAGHGQDLAKSCAEAIFEAWLSARHQAAGDLLFDGVVAAISELRNDHPQAVVGAITNSRADPYAVRELAPLFDFCVSGEHADVFPHRKPSPVIFELALQRARAASSDWSDPPEVASHADGCWWVHVGDDLPNDVRASSLAGAAPIWVTGESGSGLDPQAHASYSTATPEEVEIRNKAAAEARDLAAAEITSVVELPALLRHWRDSAQAREKPG